MLFKLVLKSDQVLWNSYCSEPSKERILNICEKGKKLKNYLILKFHKQTVRLKHEALLSEVDRKAHR